VTDLAVFSFDETGEMILASVHPGVRVEQVQAEVSWPLKLAPDVQTTEPPTAEELRLIREELDPGRMYA
jgi:glutaconate CoA-transferase subunit B